MADTTWQPSSPLIEDLLSRGHEFSFDQVMRLARTVLGSDTAPELPKVSWQEQLRTRPDLSLAFPAADVAQVERVGDDAELLVTTTFLGLYGVSSPLPTHYTEELIDEAAGDSSISRDFLDIIHQRLYQLYFQSWSKYRLFIRVAEENNPWDRERLFSLIGLGEKELRDCLPDAWSLARYAGLLTKYPRSAQGLRTLLRDALGMKDLEIEQCVFRNVPIPVDQKMNLGIPGTRLGVDAFLGRELPDRMGKFRIRIGPLCKEAFDNLLPGTPRHSKLARLVRLYITDPMEFDAKITLAAGQARQLCLGDQNGPRLGLNTWCFSGDTLGEVSATFPLSTVAASMPASIDCTIHDPAEKKEPSSLIDFYQQELARLRDLAASYAEIHPELASMVSGHLTDPGIERLLEGVAFLNANLQLKLADDIPEVIHHLIDTFEPWQMRPTPATTVVAFTPKPGLTLPLRIPAGAEVASLPVQGTTCRFRTCFEIIMHPLTLLDASFSQPSGKAPRIELSYQLNGVSLSGWKVTSLRFFLGADSPEACNLYLLLMRYLKRITLTAVDDGRCVEIPVDCLKPAGFGPHETMLGAQLGSSSGHLLLQEYFLFPDKFMFLDLYGMERCSGLGNGSRFRIAFEFNHWPFPIPPIRENSFIVSAVPVINLFPHKAKPLTIKTDTSRHLVRPSWDKPDHCLVYSVDRITEFDTGNPDATQAPLQQGSDDGEIYHITHVASSLGDGFDTYISLKEQRHESRPSKRRIDSDLTCTNGVLPEQLGLGDIRCATATTPESATFRNIKPVTAANPPVTGQNRHWRIFAGFSLNSLSLDGPENFRAILRLLIPSKCRDLANVEAHKKRIDGIVGVSALPTDRLINGRMFRGYDIRLSVCNEHYSGPGDLFLFCSALERFLGGYVTENSFIRLVMEDVSNGYIFEWPARMGDRLTL